MHVQTWQARLHSRRPRHAHRHRIACALYDIGYGRSRMRPRPPTTSKLRERGLDMGLLRLATPGRGNSPPLRVGLVNSNACTSWSSRRPALAPLAGEHDGACRRREPRSPGTRARRRCRLFPHGPPRHTRRRETKLPTRGPCRPRRHAPGPSGLLALSHTWPGGVGKGGADNLWALGAPSVWNAAVDSREAPWSRGPPWPGSLGRPARRGLIGPLSSPRPTHSLLDEVASQGRRAMPRLVGRGLLEVSRPPPSADLVPSPSASASLRPWRPRSPSCPAG